MDILGKPGLGVRVVIAVAAILGLALSVIVLQMTSEVKPVTHPHPSPLAPAPSKANVSKQVEEQIAHLRDVVARNPSDARSAIELARTLQDSHDLKGALKYYELGLKSNPGNLDARVDYSFCLYQSGNEQEALVQTETILRRDASNVRALYNLGAIYANRGEADSARHYWGALISTHPGDELARKANGNLKQLTRGGAQAM